ncbi:MAG TPA: pilus assembly protein PilB [Nostocaceae cyanobacterium]|nr:pilus assembly protein PilB [Nostocaceae cyanobacterium]
MFSSEGKQTDTATIGQHLITSIQNNSPPGENHEQIFELIDSLLSFEACLYHQILPLGIEENSLLLGMVHPEDDAASEYVSRILSYVKFTMATQRITAEAHRTILSAYLNYKNTYPSSLRQEHPSLAKFFPSQNSQAVDNQPLNTPAEHPENLHTPTSTEAENNQNSEPSIVPVPETAQTSANNHPDTPTESKVTLDIMPEDLPALPVEVPQVFSPIQVLLTLPPKQLLAELLARVLVGGIGRLYLERQPYEGKILWSDNGVVQSVLDKLPLSLFQGVLNELKRLTSLPLTKVSEPKQVEKECIYQQSRLLLRLRVMPGTYGEEATLQVLRGAALKFHQQQQLTHLSRNTLDTVQRLSQMLRELQQRLRLESDLNQQQVEALVNLSRLVENLDQQIKILTDQTHSLENGR